MNLHTMEHGRFFNEIDEENAHSVCVIGTGIRDELFGSPEQIGREIIPIGELIKINGQPFTIVGMFTRYEGEAERKERALAKSKPAEKPAGPRACAAGDAAAAGPSIARITPCSCRSSTMWVRFRSASGTNNIPDPRLTDIDVKVANMDLLEPALQQARNVLMVTHKGIEDFNFRTQENQIENIDTQIRNARLSGGLIAAISLLVGASAS